MPDVPSELLLSIAERYGTPTYAYDFDKIIRQATELKSKLPESLRVQYSLKANPSLGICELLARLGLGADTASVGELLVALKAGFSQEHIFVGGPYKAPETLSLLRVLPNAIISIDSVSDLCSIRDYGISNRILLRLRPTATSCVCEDTGFHSRFGVPIEGVRMCEEYIRDGGIHIVGFHVFSSCQVLDSAAIVCDFRAALDVSLIAADVLGIEPTIINLGGGFGVRYSDLERPLDLEPIARELNVLCKRAGQSSLVLELGRYLVAEAGWYLTSVVANQTNGKRRAVVVDGGTHQRNDICRMGLPSRLAPYVLRDNGSPFASISPTDVLGCLCLPDDILAKEASLPWLDVGDVLAFPTAGAYGLSASPTRFLGHPLPAEIAFRKTAIEVLRPRENAEAVLAGQRALENLLWESGNSTVRSFSDKGFPLFSSNNAR